MSHAEMIGTNMGYIGSVIGERTERRCVGWVVWCGVMFVYDERRMIEWRVPGKRTSPLIYRIENIRMDPGVQRTLPHL